MSRWKNRQLRTRGLLALSLLILGIGSGCESGFSDSPAMEPDNDDAWWNEHKAPFEERMWEAESPEPDVGYDPELSNDETWPRPAMETEDFDDGRFDEDEPTPDTEFDSP